MTTPSLPDTQERYPSEELMLLWRSKGCACSICFIAAVKTALDWQREQDALICDSTASYYGYAGDEAQEASEQLSSGDKAYAARECASAIRTPPQPGAAQ